MKSNFVCIELVEKRSWIPFNGTFGTFKTTLFNFRCWVEVVLAKRKLHCVPTTFRDNI